MAMISRTIRLKDQSHDLVRAKKYPAEDISVTGLQDLGFDEWKEFLLNFPQFAPRYNWSTLRPCDWNEMPFIPKQFSANLDWVREHGENWAKVLDGKPELFREKCEWSSLTGLNWGWLLRWKPEFADLCDWKKLSESDWCFLLLSRPQFFKYLHLDNLCNRRWVELINVIPQITERINWVLMKKNVSKFSGVVWLDLLVKNACYAEICDWEKLEERPIRCPKCLESRGMYWKVTTCWDVLLSERPELSKYRNWDRYYGANWRELQKKHPNAFDNANRLVLTGSEWVELLIKEPQYANLCQWNKIEASDWLRLLTVQPQFANKRNWGKIDTKNLQKEENGMRLRSNRYRYRYRYQREEVNGTHWVTLLSAQPQFADRCDWSKLGGEDWVSLLSARPQFADRCDWKRLKGWDWLKLLTVHPQFADKCSWDKVNDDFNA